MLRLLQSIFGGTAETATGDYSPELIEAAIQRAIDATDRRLHALSDVRKRLTPGVVKAVDHVVKLVDSLAAPVAATAENHARDPRLNVLFANPERMIEVLAKDTTVNEARSELKTDTAFGLLVAHMSRRTVLASDMVDGDIRQDVMQTVVSFDEHQILEVSADLEQTRRQLKRRAFDVILRQVLETLEERQQQQTELKSQHGLLMRKLGLLQQAGWNFESGDSRPDTVALEKELQHVEDELLALGDATKTLPIHAELVQKALVDAATLLSLDKPTLYLDRRSVERKAGQEGAQAVELQILRDRKGNERAALLIQFDPMALPKFDFLQAASKALA